MKNQYLTLICSPPNYKGNFTMLLCLRMIFSIIISHLLICTYRKLADISRNNMLDIDEFAVAMHLIQSRLKGKNIPEKLPETLTPVNSPTVDVPAMLQEEREAYGRAFLWKSDSKMGCVDGEIAKHIRFPYHCPLGFVIQNTAWLSKVKSFV